MVVVKKKDERVRNWSFIAYPDSVPENWRDIIDDLHVPWVESPLHDKDVNPDGEVKKAHWHIAMFFNTKKSYDQIFEIAKSINATVPEKIENAKGLIRYFLHMDNPEKYQYSKSEMIAHGGADVEKYLTATGSDHLKILAEIQEWIDENDCTELVDLARYAVKEKRDDWYPVITSKSTLFLNAYLRSNRHSRKSDEDVEQSQSEDAKMLKDVEQEFLMIQAKNIPQKAKNMALVGLKNKLEREYGSFVLEPKTSDLSRSEVILYQAIVNAMETK